MFVKSDSVRVRFAPSPTGYLHVGGARTALFNYLFARRHEGVFLLRIEDTDVSRSREELTEVILRSLRWLGLAWDDDPVRQSTRMQRYREVCEKLVEKGWAYPCFCSSEALEKRRQKAGAAYTYDRRCLALSEQEIRERLDRGIPRAIRLRVPDGETTFQDAVRGTVIVQNKQIDDFILLRSDETPVYQVAVVVDDHEMGITHVIRGDDHLSNTPKQILIYQAMEWDIPTFAHVPMILGPDKKRLSKRHGATSVEEYEKAGFLPQAVVNFLALLGWSPGDDREMMSLEEMAACFSLNRVSKNPAVLDETKLTWMNGQYLSRMPEEELFALIADKVEGEGLMADPFAEANRSYLLRCMGLMKERMKKVGDFVNQGRYFLVDPEEYEEEAVRKHWSREDLRGWFETLYERLGALPSWEADRLEETIRGFADEMGVGAGKVIHPIRVALTGTGASPGLFALMEVLGRERVTRRLQRAMDYLQKR